MLTCAALPEKNPSVSCPCISTLGINRRNCLAYATNGRSWLGKISAAECQNSASYGTPNEALFHVVFMLRNVLRQLSQAVYRSRLTFRFDSILGLDRIMDRVPEQDAGL